MRVLVQASNPHASAFSTVQWKWYIAVSPGTGQIIPLYKITVVSHLAVFTVISHLASFQWAYLIFTTILAPPVRRSAKNSWGI